MLYFVCFIFGILLFFDYFCNDFIVDLFTENKEIVIIIIIIFIRGEALISMWIPKGTALIRGRCLFETRRFLKEIWYWFLINVAFLNF